MSTSTEAAAATMEAAEIAVHIKCHEQNIRALKIAMISHDAATRTRAQRTINNLERQLFDLRQDLLILAGGRTA